MQAWNFAPGDTALDEDTERYALMSAGTQDRAEPAAHRLSPRDGDPVELIAVGPFAQLNPGDSV